ncbi:Crp/Fnr family transcriptional regulator [Paenibacillus sp. Marseille-Q4541]|uniref:Crp/Fnr family transcriptional regulator n=1 Tax=Paenibacillus sp. Marseille-Q4541 TaxID=2831522 RepID=UPI001BA47483|nr:Crp/Fnr family transcriptional regulator [Paenibacillus sp. Marseille-Q4541]
MILHKGEILFRQGDTGPLYHLKSGMLKIMRIQEDGGAFLVNIIVPGEMIPHHSLISPGPCFGTAIALSTCDIEVIPAADWYYSLSVEPERYKDVALKLQDKLRMMQQRMDQVTETEPAERLRKLQSWMEAYISPEKMTDLLTQAEIGQLIGLRRETVNRLLRSIEIR